MRVRAPEPFSITMVGPEGPYTLSFSRYDSSEWEGFLDVRLGTLDMHWEMEAAYSDAGELSLQGGTGVQTEPVWGDVFWYILYPTSTSPRIEFWGDRVLSRTDFAAA